MRIGIIGNGVVGHATARCFMEFTEVMVHDAVKEKSTHSWQNVASADLVFICLPSPKKKDGLACDTSIIENELADWSSWDKEMKTNTNLVLRSTVPIGFTRRMREKYSLKNLCHSPEFLTARCSISDAMLPSRNIVGDSGGFMPESGAYSCQGAVELFRLYARRFPETQILSMSSDESEAVKLFTNGFGAVTVALWNEFRCLADKLGMDWNRVQQGVLSDGRISNNWSKVPGHDGYGFSGACLPKDLANLIQCLTDAGVPSNVTAAAMERNKFDRERT